MPMFLIIISYRILTIIQFRDLYQSRWDLYDRSHISQLMLSILNELIFCKRNCKILCKYRYLIFHYHWWTASIKPRLLFSHSGLVFWGLPFLQFKKKIQNTTSKKQTTKIFAMAGIEPLTYRTTLWSVTPRPPRQLNVSIEVRLLIVSN